MKDMSVILFPFHKVEKDSRVIIYGAGDVGQAFYWELVYSGYAQIIGWLDKVWENEPILGQPKKRFSELETLEYDYVVIAINSPKVAKDICNVLQKAGVPEEKIVYEPNNVFHYDLVDYKKLYENTTVKVSETTTQTGRRLKLGFIAAGHAATSIARTVKERMTGMELYAVAARDGDRAKQFAQTYGFECWYSSYDELLQDENVDIVYISTPLSFHYEHTMKALESGKHVICEKPIAANTKQLSEMIDFAQRKKLFLADGLWISYMPIMKEIEKLREDRTIGAIKGVILNATYPNVPEGRLMKYELCGGGWLELGCYLIHMLITLLGADIKQIEAISMKSENGVDLQESVLLAYEEATAVIHCGIQSLSDRGAYIYGEHGYAIIEDANEPVRIRIFNKERKLVKQVELDAGFQYQMLACAEAIEKGFLETEERSHTIMLEQMRILEQVKEKINLYYAVDKED